MCHYLLLSTVLPNQEILYFQKLNFSDAIKNIELKGPSDYKMSQDSSLAFHIDGRSVSLFSQCKV